MDAQKRVALTGRLRDGFPLLQLAPRLGVICFFVMLFLIPVQLMGTHVNAALIVRGASGESTQGMILVLRVMQALTALHLILAIGRGGSVGCFLRPIKNVRWMLSQIISGQNPQTLNQWAGEALTILKPGYHFMLGLKGVFGAIAWLFIPTGMLVAYSAPDRYRSVVWNHFVLWRSVHDSGGGVVAITSGASGAEWTISGNLRSGSGSPSPSQGTPGMDDFHDPALRDDTAIVPRKSKAPPGRRLSGSDPDFCRVDIPGRDWPWHGPFIGELID